MTNDNLNPGGDPNNNLNPSSDPQPKWTSQLPGDLQKNEELNKFDKIGDLSKAYLELSEKQKNSLQLLGENATDEDRATFFKKLGRPDAPEGYKFAETQWPENIEDYIKTAANEDIELFRPLFHEIGITESQAQKLINKYMSLGIERWQKAQKDNVAAQEKVKADLQKEWGDDYKTKIEVMTRGIEKAAELAGIAKEEVKEFMNTVKLLDGSVIGDVPLLIKLFHAFGKAISEDSALDRDQLGDPRLDEEPGIMRLDFPSMRKKK